MRRQRLDAMPRVSISLALLALATLALLVSTSGCASGGDRSRSRVSRSDGVPWQEARAALQITREDRVSLVAADLARLDRVLRTRIVHREEDLRFGHFVLAAGALLPLHGRAAPEAFHIVAGEAEWTVDGETRSVGPGTTVFHAPYAEVRMVVTSKEPLRAVFARWAPDADRSGLTADGARRKGGSSTGNFFAQEKRSRSVLVTERVAPITKPSAGSALDEMRLELMQVKLSEPRRAVVRKFADAQGIPWNTKNAGIRWRPISATLEMEWGHVIVTPPGSRGGRRRIPPSRVPGLLHVFSGQAELTSGGDHAEVRRGTTFAFDPGEEIEVEFEEDAEPLRALWVRWAPDGDKDYLDRAGYLIENVPESPRGVSLSADLPFFSATD